MLSTFNVRVVSRGYNLIDDQPLQKTMFIANHISWLDIHALNSIQPLRFVAKSDIGDWPVFGYLVRKANTLFIEREKRQHAARIVDVITKSLQAGDNVCLFPEGTTTDGTEIKPFKSSLIQAAISAGAAIYPVAIRYPCNDNSTNTEMAYAGDTTLLESMKLILRQKQPVVELHFLPPIPTAEPAVRVLGRRVLTQKIENQIRVKLGM